MRKGRTDREIVYSILTEVMGGAKDQLNDDMLLGDWLGVAGDSIACVTGKILNVTRNWTVRQLIVDLEGRQER